MRTLGTVVACLALLLVTGCGGTTGTTTDPATGGPSGTPAPSSASGSPGGPGEGPTTSWRGCTAEDLAAAPGRSGPLRTGTGTVTVHVVPAGPGPCSDAVVVRGDRGLTGLDTTGLDLDPATAQVVRLRGPGAPELLRVDSSPHPRGGFQPHLFVVTATGPTEVLHRGAPLVPFVATDGGAPPMTATCTPTGRVAVLTATASRPPGIILAWDLRRTTYDVGAGTATMVSSELVLDHAADPVLRREWPELFDPALLFAGCSAPWGR